MEDKDKRSQFYWDVTHNFLFCFLNIESGHYFVQLQYSPVYQTQCTSSIKSRMSSFLLTTVTFACVHGEIDVLDYFFLNALKLLNVRTGKRKSLALLQVQRSPTQTRPCFSTFQIFLTVRIDKNPQFNKIFFGGVKTQAVQRRHRPTIKAVDYVVFLLLVFPALFCDEVHVFSQWNEIYAH